MLRSEIMDVGGWGEGGISHDRMWLRYLYGSAGQKLMLRAAAAGLCESRLWCVDEPFAALINIYRAWGFRTVWVCC